jgi:hypothetical protein
MLERILKNELFSLLPKILWYKEMDKNELGVLEFDIFKSQVLLKLNEKYVVFDIEHFIKKSLISFNDFDNKLSDDIIKFLFDRFNLYNEAKKCQNTIKIMILKNIEDYKFPTVIINLTSNDTIHYYLVLKDMPNKEKKLLLE